MMNLPAHVRDRIPEAAQRYRLVRARGGSGTGACFVYASDERELRHFAEAFAEEADTPILVCSHPEGGLVKSVFTVGGELKLARR